MENLMSYWYRIILNVDEHKFNVINSVGETVVLAAQAPTIFIFEAREPGKVGSEVGLRNENTLKSFNSFL